MVVFSLWPSSIRRCCWRGRRPCRAVVTVRSRRRPSSRRAVRSDHCPGVIAADVGAAHIGLGADWVGAGHDFLRARRPLRRRSRWRRSCPRPPNGCWRSSFAPRRWDGFSSGHQRVTVRHWRR